MTKAVNYTPEQETQMATDYVAGKSVDEIAEALGKSVKSVVAKLSRLGVYKTKVKAVSETARVTKASLVAQIEARYGADPGSLAELEKLTKATLILLTCKE